MFDFKMAQQFVDDLNSEPSAEHIKKNDDGSLYLPISVVQTQLDDIFMGQWNFQVTETFFGRKWARGSGYIEAFNPITQMVVRRNGDAGIILTGNLRTDSPRLEAMILLSCAKKFGKIFGRDLNRTKDDAPLPVIKIEKRDPTNEEKRMEILIDECDDIEELTSYKLLIPETLKKKYESKLKKLSA
jgi:hypothetical protein